LNAASERAWRRSTEAEHTICPRQESKTVRDPVVLACTKCKRRNYTTKKNKKRHPDRLVYKKFCPNCNEHTEHKETK
jgi:large subunit ribosomal protein L33